MRTGFDYLGGPSQFFKDPQDVILAEPVREEVGLNGCGGRVAVGDAVLFVKVRAGRQVSF